MVAERLKAARELVLPARVELLASKALQAAPCVSEQACPLCRSSRAAAWRPRVAGVHEGTRPRGPWLFRERQLTPCCHLEVEGELEKAYPRLPPGASSGGQRSAAT